MHICRRIRIDCRHVRLGLGLLLIIDSVFFLSIGGGVNTGIFLPALIGLCLLAGPSFSHALQARLRPKTYSRLSGVFRAGLLLWLISFILIEGFILWNALPRTEKELDWLIVLGGGLRGETPRLSLVQRLNTAADYLRGHRQTRVIVSGGQGRGESITEAEAMRRFLELRGIESDRIFKEERSSSTLENLVFSKAILDAHSSDSKAIGVLSSDFHLFRVNMLARRVGLTVSVVPAPSPWYLLPNHALREYLAIIKSMICDFP